MWLSTFEFGGAQFRSTTTFFMCEQKLYPVWFPQRRKKLSCAVWTQPKLVLQERNQKRDQAKGKSSKIISESSCRK